MNNNIKGTRKIKCVGNSVDTNEFFLHPITLELVKNKGPKKICPTELHYVNGKPYTAAPIDNTNLSDRDIQSFMTVPYLNLNMEQMLSIYKIDSIDSMIKWLDNNNDKPIETINRILMVWIRLNFDDLKNNNRILSSIYKKINNKYYKRDINTEELEKKINNWFKKTTSDAFHLDLTKYIFS
jgi:hypothetical protein